MTKQPLRLKTNQLPRKKLPVPELKAENCEKAKCHTNAVKVTKLTQENTTEVLPDAVIASALSIVDKLSTPKVKTGLPAPHHVMQQSSKLSSSDPLALSSLSLQDASISTITFTSQDNQTQTDFADEMNRLREALQLQMNENVKLQSQIQALELESNVRS